MNISAGYEIKAGTKNYLRFEPYYKIPLMGVGTGSLPLSSAGVQYCIYKTNTLNIQACMYGWKEK